MDTLMVTGHRPDKLGGYGWGVFASLVAFAEEQILAEAPKIVVSGMALGWDLAVAVAAIRLREQGMDIRLRSVLPFASQYVKWRDPKAAFIWTKVLCKADEVILLQRGAPNGSVQAIFWLDERNHAMVDMSEKVIALWNGSSGGTKNCLGYARYRARPIVNVWEQWASFRR